MKPFKLYTEVQLTKDIPESGFKSGDVATLVEIVKGDNGKDGYCLEFFDSGGKTLDVIIVNKSDIRKPILHGVVNYRKFLKEQT